MALTYNAPDNILADAFNSVCPDYSADVFKIALLNAYTFNAAHDEWLDVNSTEIADANGYDTPGQNLTSVSSVQAGGTYVLDAASPVWTAASGTIGPATDAEIYNDTAVGDRLICNIDFGASHSAADGSNFQLTFNNSGIFIGAF